MVNERNQTHTARADRGDPWCLRTARPCRSKSEWRLRRWWTLAQAQGHWSGGHALPLWAVALRGCLCKSVLSCTFHRMHMVLLTCLPPTLTRSILGVRVSERAFASACSRPPQGHGTVQWVSVLETWGGSAVESWNEDAGVFQNKHGSCQPGEEAGIASLARKPELKF